MPVNFVSVMLHLTRLCFKPIKLHHAVLCDRKAQCDIAAFDVLLYKVIWCDCGMECMHVSKNWQSGQSSSRWKQCFDELPHGGILHIMGYEKCALVSIE